MRVILREDLEGRGKAGDTVEVKSGYARNFLLPRNLAIVASRGNVSALDAVKREKDIRVRKTRREADKIRERIEAVAIEAVMQVGEDDRVFGAVTAQMIADLLAAKGITIDRRKIVLEDNIKALGVYSVPVKIDADVTAQVKLFVSKKGFV